MKNSSVNSPEEAKPQNGLAKKGLIQVALWVSKEELRLLNSIVEDVQGRFSDSAIAVPKYVIVQFVFKKGFDQPRERLIEAVYNSIIRVGNNTNHAKTG